MSGSGRKLSSKWDPRNEPEFAPESVANSNSSRSFYLETNDELKPRMGFSRKEPFFGGRGSNKDDVKNEDYRVLDATIAQDNDGNYDMKLSPRFEEWKSKKHSQSTKNDYSRNSQSRSRSRSPPRGFRWDSGVNGRNRMSAGGLTQPCRDFAVGNCRRGSHCHFLHHDKQSYEDGRESRHRQDGTPRYSTLHGSREYSHTSGRSNEACINFAKGRCRTGASCKYVHHGNSDGFGEVSGDESSRERETDRRSIENSFKQGGRHYSSHSGNTPCKFFAFGNCRNGKDCRFSHDSQAFRSPNRRLRDDRLRSNQGEDQTLDRQKLCDSFSPNGRLRDDRWGSDGSMAGVDKVWDGPKQNDLVAVSDTAKLVEENNSGIMGAREHGFLAWPISDGLDHILGKNRLHNESPFSIDKKEANCWTAENAVDNSILISQSAGRGIWPGDEKMSPDWNYGARSSSHIKEEHGQNKEHAAPGQGLNQNAQIVTASHAVGQSQAAVSIVPPRARIIEGMQNQEFSTEKKYTVEPNIMNASLSQISLRNPPTQNIVSKEQLAQLSCLSASLAHILGTDRQLPQLHSTLNSSVADNPFTGKNEGFGNPVSLTFIKPDPAIGLKQYDTMCDSMEPKNTNASGVPPAFSPSIKTPKDAVEIPPPLSNPGQNFDDSCKTAISEEQPVKNEHLIQLQQGENIKVKKESNEMVAEEKLSSRSENKLTEEDSPLENMDQNVEPDGAKKIKDMKGIRAFKFSLVEFTKELLKPTWKEGQITKEDYKAIVKKVTDKVTGTVQRAHIPQTQEKIDRYLSISKPKLSKLVQVSGGSLTDFRHMYEGFKILSPI